MIPIFYSAFSLFVVKAERCCAGGRQLYQNQHSKQTEAVNDYLHSVHADGDGSMSEKNCEHRRIASQNITIAAIRILDSRQLDRLQNVLDHIAYDREYYMPERGCGMHR